MGVVMDKKDFKSLLSEAFEKNNKKIVGRFEGRDRKFRKLLKVSFERYDNGLKKFLKKVFEENNKKIRRDVREEFSRFVDVSIIPQFEDIRKEMNDASHCRDQILRTLVKHEDRFDHLDQRQDKILKVLEKQGGRLERIEAKLQT